MVIYAFLFILLCLYKVNLKGDKTGFQRDYMSIEKTEAIKGIFIIIVFFSHFMSYVEFTSPGDKSFYRWFSLIGQRMVTLFMFYSGYGVMESVAKKGIAYIKSIPRKRFLFVLVQFDIAVTVFTVLKLISGSKFSGGKVFDIKQYLLSLVGWESVGNSNWYIFAVLVLYIITFIAFVICKGKTYPSLISATVLTVLFIIILRITGIKKQFWYDTMLCFTAGMWYSVLRKHIDKFFMKKQTVYWLSFVSVIVLAVASIMIQDVNFVFRELSYFLFTASVVLFTMKISLCNKVLVWCGKNLFGLYIYQRIPMNYLQMAGLDKFNIYVYFAVCAVFSVILAYCSGKLTGVLKKSKLFK